MAASSSHNTPDVGVKEPGTSQADPTPKSISKKEKQSTKEPKSRSSERRMPKQGYYLGIYLFVDWKWFDNNFAMGEYHVVGGWGQVHG